MLTETEFNALGEKLKDVTHNKKGTKVLRAYLSMDYAFYCESVSKNEGLEPSDVIFAEYDSTIRKGISKLKYYSDGRIYHDCEDVLDLVL